MNCLVPFRFGFSEVVKARNLGCGFGGLGCVFDVFDQEQQVQWVCWGGDETEPGIKGGGFWIFGVNKDGANSDGIGGFEASEQGVFKEGFADSFSLLLLVNGEARQEDDREGVVGHAFSDTFRSGGFLNGTCAE